jgi:hypothetical protein
MPTRTGHHQSVRQEDAVTAPFAFAVAIEEKGEEVSGYYDADQQQFIWEGEADTTLGTPVCTRTLISNPYYYHNCYVPGQTSCTLSSPCIITLGCPGYKCDYG